MKKIFLYDGNEAEILDVQIVHEQGKPKLLGKGGYAKVFLGEMIFKYSDIQKTIKIAIKRIEIPKKNDHNRIVELIKRESSIYQSIKSQHIVQYYGDNIENNLDALNYVDFYLELCDGNLVNLLYDKVKGQDILLNEDEALSNFSIIVNTVCLLKWSQILRSENRSFIGVFHRDINLNNVLFTTKRGRKVLKICDFGISQYADSQIITVRQGTEISMAPENADKLPYELEKNDAWSQGVMLFQFLFGQSRFLYLRNKFINADKIWRVEYLKQILPKISPSTQDLLVHLLEPKSDERWYFEDIVQSKALKQTGKIMMLMKIIQYKLKQRLDNYQEIFEIVKYCEQQKWKHTFPKHLKEFIVESFRIWSEKQFSYYNGLYSHSNLATSVYQAIVNLKKIVNEHAQQFPKASKIIFKPDDSYYYQAQIVSLYEHETMEIQQNNYLIKKLKDKLKEKEKLKDKMKEKQTQMTKILAEEQQSREYNKDLKIKKILATIQELDETNQKLSNSQEVVKLKDLNTKFADFSHWKAQKCKLYSEHLPIQ